MTRGCALLQCSIHKHPHRQDEAAATRAGFPETPCRNAPAASFSGALIKTCTDRGMIAQDVETIPGVSFYYSISKPNGSYMMP